MNWGSTSQPCIRRFWSPSSWLQGWATCRLVMIHPAESTRNPVADPWRCTRGPSPPKPTSGTIRPRLLNRVRGMFCASVRYRSNSFVPLRVKP